MTGLKNLVDSLFLGMSPFFWSDAAFPVPDVVQIKECGSPRPLSIHPAHAGASSAFQPELCLKRHTEREGRVAGGR